MPESSFAKLDHRVPMARADVNRIGPGWDPNLAPEGSTRADPTTYFPLVAPGGLPSEPLPGPAASPPPAPTEAELRETLEQCISAKAFADTNLQRAQETHDRAGRHVERCRTALENFATLDDEVTEATVEALRSGDGRPRVDLSDELRRRVSERNIARDDLVAAERAAVVLAEGLTASRVDADAAMKAARTAAVAVVALEAEAMALRVLQLEAEAARIREAMFGFDRINIGTGMPFPLIVRKVFGLNNPRFLRPIDASAWQAARDALLDDPTAEVVIPVPDRIGPAIDNTVAPVARTMFSHEVVHAVPISDWKPAETEEHSDAGLQRHCAVHL
jgi:hypothetical protein